MKNVLVPLLIMATSTWYASPLRGSHGPTAPGVSTGGVPGLDPLGVRWAAAPSGDSYLLAGNWRGPHDRAYPTYGRAYSPQWGHGHGYQGHGHGYQGHGHGYQGHGHGYHDDGCKCAACRHGGHIDHYYRSPYGYGYGYGYGNGYGNGYGAYGPACGSGFGFSGPRTSFWIGF